MLVIEGDLGLRISVASSIFCASRRRLRSLRLAALTIPTLFTALLPQAGDGDEPECQMPRITEECKAKATAPWAAYEACKVRLAKHKEGDCEAWYFDFLKAVDQCRVPQIFKTLK
jgi:Ubiquinol-cytochrome C reductase hinge protein